MSSNIEQVPNAGAQAMAEEALLKEIGRRAPSPTQAVKVCQILGLATGENIRRVREIAKNKTAFEAGNKNPEEKMGEKIKEEWGHDHYLKIGISLVEKLMKRAIKKEGVEIGRVDFDDALYASLKLEDRVENYDYVVQIMTRNGGFCTEFGYGDLTICVLSEKYLRLARRFAKLYKEKTNKSVVLTKSY